MKLWLTAREIAEARLPELPTVESSIIRMAEREGWDTHPSYARGRRGRGGGVEYNFRILPTVAQVAWAQRHMIVGDESEAEAPIQESQPEALTDRGARERDARLAIVAAFERFHKGSRLGLMAGLQVFTDKYRFGSLAVEPWVKDLVPSVSKRTLQAWIAAKRKGETGKLAVDRGLARKGTGVIDRAEDGRLRTFVLALLAQNPHFSAQHVRTLCRSEFGDTVRVGEKTIPLPPVRTFQHAIKGLKAANKVALTKLTNPDLFRSTMAPAGVGALRHINAPNMLWQIDASPVDALCTDGRHSVYACIDIFSRRSVFLISKTPRASAVALLVRKAILAWGVPRTIKTDNGSDFVAQDTQRLLAALDIEMELSDAYSPQQKGHVERLIRTFQHDFATLVPGFVGHSVADRKAIESRKSFAQRLGEPEAETFGVSLAGDELQVLADRWTETVYEVRAHAGLKGMSPRNVYQSANFRPRTVDVRALDLLLMPVAGNGKRTATKFGVRVNGYHYATPRVLPGTECMVRMDPADKGKVYLYALDGSGYLGEGVCPELAGIHPETFMRAVREEQAEAIERVTKPVKKVMKDLAKGPAPIERALRIAAEDAPNVVPLPKRTEEHLTPQIAAALDAIDAMAARAPSIELDEATLAEHERLVAEHEAGVAERRQAELPANTVAIETPKTRYRRALKVLEQIEDGTANPYDVLWLGHYREGAEFKSQRDMHEDFGDAYLT